MKEARRVMAEKQRRTKSGTDRGRSVKEIALAGFSSRQGRSSCRRQGGAWVVRVSPVNGSWAEDDCERCR
jgi:hypothetical protein